MTELLGLLNSRIAKTAKEHAEALAKAEEYQNKAVEFAEKAAELEVHLRYLKQWTSEFATPPGEVHEAKSDFYTGSYTRPFFSLRALVKECLTQLHDFRSCELIAAAQAIRPNAKEGSIRAELSHSKARGDVVLLEKDYYRSMTSVPPAPKTPDASRVQTNNEGENDEPEFGFGRIAE